MCKVSGCDESQLERMRVFSMGALPHERLFPKP
jgi:hypothetical protein